MQVASQGTSLVCNAGILGRNDKVKQKLDFFIYLASLDNELILKQSDLFIDISNKTSPLEF